MGPILAAKRELTEQDGVEGDDDGDRKPAGDAGVARAGEALHDVAAVDQQKQRDKSEGQCEAEDNLREDQYPERVKAGGDDGDGGDDSDGAAQEDGELDVEEALDDDLAGHDANGGGRQSRAEERDGEDGGGEGSEERAEGVVRLLNGGLEIAGVDEGDGGHEDHGGVDEPCAVHGDEDVDELVVQETAKDGAARQQGGLLANFEVLQRLAGRQSGAGELFETWLHQRGVEIDDVRHDGGAQHGDGGIDAVVEVLRGGAVEGGQQGGDGGELPVGMDEEDLEGVGDANDGDAAHDAALQPAEPGEVECEDGEDQNSGDERGDQQRLLGGEAAGVKQGAEEQVEADSGAEKFGEIGGHCGDFGGDPDRKSTRL